MMKTMNALVVMGALAACNSGSVTGPSIIGPGPGGTPGPGPEVVNGADIQGSGILATESREVAGFSRVRLDGVGHLIVEQGGAEALTITADDNLLPLVTAEVYGDELRLGTDARATWASPNPIVFTLTVANCEALGVFGAAAAEIRGLDAHRFAVHVEGAGTVSAAGRADEQEVVLRGVATYDARALPSRAVRVDVAGVSRATVRVRERLEGRIEGQSTVEYIGRPIVDVTGGGAVQPIDG
jgi:hypothetical protein